MLNKKSPLKLLFGVLLICSFATWQITSEFFATCYKAPINSRVIEESDHLELLWEINDIYVPSSSNGVFLNVLNSELTYYGANRRCGRNRLNILDLEGNFIRHEQDFTSRRGLSTMTANSKFVVIGFNSTGKVGVEAAGNDAFRGAGGIAVYSSQISNIAWQKKITGTLGIDELALYDDLIITEGGSRALTPQYLLIDAADGTIINAFDYTDTLPPISPYAYLYGNRHLDSPEMFNRWVDVFQNVYQAPIAQSGYVILRDENGVQVGTISVLKEIDASRMWFTPNVVLSNVAVNREFALFLTQTSELIVAKLETGEQMGSVKFSPSEAQMIEDGGFFVAVNEDNLIFVYFGDSRQLFAFEFNPN